MTVQPSSPPAFWHPFGPHVRESPNAILERKRLECLSASWTLWTFQVRRPKTIAEWLAEIQRSEGAVTVYCGGSTCAEPGAGSIAALDSVATHWKASLDGPWRPVPTGVNPTYHRAPRKDGVIAYAFCVESVDLPESEHLEGQFAWRRCGCGWDRTLLPTRGEYLIRPEKGASLLRRNLRAVLKLRRPWVVWVGRPA